MDNEVYRTAIVVDSNRVNHYSDVIDSMVQAEVARCQEKEKFLPTPDQQAFYKKELIRAMVIRRQIDAASKIKISNNRILNETHSVPTRNGKQRKSI
jgi:hypothetical protein